MASGLGNGNTIDGTGVLLNDTELPSLPDDAVSDRTKGWLDHQSWYPNRDRPFEIEIGSGKGTFLCQQAPIDTDINFFGMEWAGEFCHYAADRVRRNGFSNVRMYCGDAFEMFTWRFADGIADTVHLYFPDPWPKKKHHKKRSVRDDFLTQIHRVLKPGGELRVVTDHLDYWAWMEAHFDRWTTADGVGGLRFDRDTYHPPASAGEGEMVGTNFERKYRVEGRVFNGAVLRKPE